MQNVRTFPIIPRRRIFSSGFGEYTGERRGSGYDLISERPYIVGVDDMRRIDWKTSAKHETLLVREFRQAEILRLVLVVDRAPRMAWYPEPWLSKPKVLVRTGQIIIDSAADHRCLIGYLDYADWAKENSVFWRPPNQGTEAERIRNRNIPHPHFTAPEENLSMALEWLLACGAQVPQETFVFILSDWFVTPHHFLLEEAVARWDFVPVVIQDPILEASFPIWNGKIPAQISTQDSSGCRQKLVLSGDDSKKLRREHEKHFADILRLFRDLGAAPVSISSDDPDFIWAAFSEWSASRLEGRR